MSWPTEWRVALWVTLPEVGEREREAGVVRLERQLASLELEWHGNSAPGFVGPLVGAGLGVERLSATGSARSPNVGAQSSALVPAVRLAAGGSVRLGEHLSFEVAVGLRSLARRVTVTAGSELLPVARLSPFARAGLVMSW